MDGFMTTHNIQAQALHPLPYPDSEKPEPDWRKQIYNAWWNGVILGYPEYFVDGLNTAVVYNKLLNRSGFIRIPREYFLFTKGLLIFACLVQATARVSTMDWTRASAWWR